MERMRSTHTDRDGNELPRYFHRGYIIQKCKRDWSARGGPRGMSSQVPPLISWEVHQMYRRDITDFNTRREAVAWIETQTPDW